MKAPAISYSRYSSDDQADGTSVERQQETIKSYASSKELDIVEILIDDGYSASKGEHISYGKFGRLLKEVDKGTYRGYGLILERQDRLSRLGNTETVLLYYRLITAGVIVHLVKENRIIKDITDLNEMGTAVMNTVRACADQEFSNKLSERITRAWKAKNEAARASRIPIGNLLPGWLAIEGQVKSGDKIVDHGRIIQVPEKVAIVKEIYRLAGQGVGSRNICRQLNGRIDSRSWVSKTLKSRAVLGEFQPGKSGEVIQNYFPQIISQSEFDAARAQMEAKRKNGKYIGGNKCKSDTASNLFSGLMFDITSEPVSISDGLRGKSSSAFTPERKMDFQTVRQHTHYVMTAFNSGAPSNRMRYDKLEKAILGFLSKADWKAISAESESDEFKAAKAELEAILRQIDIVSREIASNTEAMHGEDVETRKFLARQIVKDEAVLATLTEKKDALQATVEAAQAKSADLAETKTFRELLSQLNSNPALRLKFRAEIKKKVSRIELVFMPDKLGVAAIIQFSNGVFAGTIIFGKAVEQDALQARGLSRIERYIVKPEFHETLKKELLELAHSLAV